MTAFASQLFICYRFLQNSNYLSVYTNAGHSYWNTVIIITITTIAIIIIINRIMNYVQKLFFFNTKTKNCQLMSAYAFQ
jgi:hypothetical protein